MLVLNRATKDNLKATHYTVTLSETITYEVNVTACSVGSFKKEIMKKLKDMDFDSIKIGEYQVESVKINKIEKITNPK